MTIPTNAQTTFTTIGIREDLAEAIYERLGEISYHRIRMDLKLADVKHLRGDVDGERVLRESIYGRLEYEEHKLD